MAYQRLTAADQQGIRNALQHVASGVASAKLLRALEADHFARTLLGEKLLPVESRTAGMTKPVPPVTPPNQSGGGQGGGPPGGQQ